MNEYKKFGNGTELLIPREAIMKNAIIKIKSSNEDFIFFGKLVETRDVVLKSTFIFEP
jgi:hypothetical protein